MKRLIEFQLLVEAAVAAEGLRLDGVAGAKGRNERLFDRLAETGGDPVLMRRERGRRFP